MKIAIVGTGISGLVAAHYLHRGHDVTVFEAAERTGGHSNTVDVDLGGGERHRVDTGFIVYNERTYPEFSRLLTELGVASREAEMSFSVTCERSGLEYATHSASGLFARRRNAVDPGFYWMLGEILRFNRAARALVETPGAGLSLRAFLAGRRFSARFVAHYIVPMGAAIWSAAPDRFLDFPAESFARFFHNHGLLDHRAPLRWRTIRGGSRTYVEAVSAPFQNRIHTGCPVLAVQRRDDGVEVLLPDGVRLRFDHAVLACHGDQALALLDDATSSERQVLGSIRYQANDVILHTDVSAMPRRAAAWASWNYRIPRTAQSAAVLTYDMGRLQSLASTQPLLVSLNCGETLNASQVLGRFQYRHPVYDADTVRAQARRGEIDGVGRTHYCGAYWGNGFHEDGVVSALGVVRRLGCLG